MGTRELYHVAIVMRDVTIRRPPTGPTKSNYQGMLILNFPYPFDVLFLYALGVVSDTCMVYFKVANLHLSFSFSAIVSTPQIRHPMSNNNRDILYAFAAVSRATGHLGVAYAIMGGAVARRSRNRCQG